MTTLILIRHGESEGNRQRRLGGFTDFDLTELGLEQARKTAQFVAEHYRVDRVYASDLRRAYKTARCLAQLLGLEVIRDSGLREIYIGRWEGVEIDYLQQTCPELVDMWRNHYGKMEFPGGETPVQHGERVMASLEEIARSNPEGTVAVATHAGVIKLVAAMLQVGSVEEIRQTPAITNASVTELRYDDGHWSMAEVCMDGHLQGSITAMP